ncbi:MAG: Hpt domain-containing protein [Flavobacteriales bacterium]|nr:Hpt domain-containing protein [Flavobacteriales bacterium]
MEGGYTDLTFLGNFCKGDRTRMEKYIRLYLQGAPGGFALMEERLGADDAEGLAVAAHSLRPQANYMGAQRLFDLLTEIEALARNKGASACTAQVKEAVELNRLVLEELYASLTPLP